MTLMTIIEAFNCFAKSTAEVVPIVVEALHGYPLVRSLCHL